ncbi:MAG: hypothetical protein Q7W45_00075 [Bacteroidota bacterium]|nr:hypothetical protein [Bacteroidota bacterium]MDP3146113.1 hypothetical protein [Bacteroidota bacterium]MDP3556729.1 hypothetical protein [Bacteroidota bacterium]
MKLMQKIGYFRLVLVPLGLLIILTAYNNSIIGMGLVGVVVLIFGILNKCLLLGKCEVEYEADSTKNESKEL